MIVPETDRSYWANLECPKGQALTRDVHEIEGVRKAPIGFRVRSTDVDERRESDEWYAAEVERMKDRAPA